MNVSQIVKFAKDIEKNNQKFAAMTPEEKRVAVAKDALATLVLGKSVGKSGVYVKSKPAKRLVTGADVKATKLPRCEVCAIGACLLGTMRVSGLGIEALNGRVIGDKQGVAFVNYVRQDTLTQIFDDDSLREMETDFEGWGPYANNEISAIDDDSVRLFAILENVIRNGGTYDPPARRDRAKELPSVKAFVKNTARRFNAACKKAHEVKA